MSEFYAGDTVQFGARGKVQYTVTPSPGLDLPGHVPVRSHNTGKLSTVETDRLVLIQGGPLRFAAVNAEDAPSASELLAEANTVAPLVGTVTHTVPERSAYSKAILAGLQLKAGHVFEGLSLTPKARAKRKAARRASKISRKANR